ncbi:ddaF [Symbiodinium sp. CCMP2592]|nr:ddaF [Symbiodinium sp. CCMP2592]
MLQEKAALRGLLVAELWSPPHPKPAPRGPALKDWLSRLSFSVSGVLAYSDPHALPIVEEVLSLVGLTGSGDVTSDALLEQARRNKHLMQVVLKEAGLTSCRWVLACSESEVQSFVEAEPSQTAVMKPFLGGSAGNNVTLLDYGNRPRESEAFVRQVFSSRPTGAESMPVLVQEHLQGDEYAVDIVVRDGEMAVMGVFKYDVRPLNGAEFVVFGVFIEPIQKGSPEEAVANYAMESLAALGMRNGPAHVEVKMTAKDPVLIEANCNRFTGLDMIFDIAERAVGYTAIDAFLDAADARVSAEEWRSRYPVLPSPNLRAYGGVAQMHARKSGIYEGGDEEAAAEIMELDSVYKLESRDIAVGYPLARTVSDATCPAEVGLLCNSRSQLMADYDRIFQIERRMFRVKETGFNIWYRTALEPWQTSQAYSIGNS